MRARIATRIGIHTHDDIGLGVANALAALDAGATHVQGTINGIGERTGNCNLTSVIPNLAFKLKKASVPGESLAMLKDISHFVDEIANLRPNPRLPWVGEAAFSHKGGQHVNAVQKLVSSYEHIDPSLVGNRRHVLMSELAGRSNVIMKARELGFDVSKETPELNAMLQRVKELEHDGFEFESADGSLALLIRRALRREAKPFTIDAYHVSMRSSGDGSVCEATVKVVVGREHAHTVAEGDGPVNALDKALRSALVKFYRDLEDVRLTDYKVRIVNSSSGTAARTRVLIESGDGTSTWTTIGVDENIIEASLQALVDSLEYALLRKDFAASVVRARRRAGQAGLGSGQAGKRGLNEQDRDRRALRDRGDAARVGRVRRAGAAERARAAAAGPGRRAAARDGRARHRVRDPVAQRPGRAVGARPRAGDRRRAARQRRAGRGRREASRSLCGVRGAADAGSGGGVRRVVARREGPGVQGRDGQRLLADR